MGKKRCHDVRQRQDLSKVGAVDAGEQCNPDRMASLAARSLPSTGLQVAEAWCQAAQRYADLQLAVSRVHEKGKGHIGPSVALLVGVVWDAYSARCASTSIVTGASRGERAAGREEATNMLRLLLEHLKPPSQASWRR